MVQTILFATRGRTHKIINTELQSLLPLSTCLVWASLLSAHTAEPVSVGGPLTLNIRNILKKLRKYHHNNFV